MIQATGEILIGAIYAIGAVFNTVYTLRHSQEFYTEFADRAWLGPARSLIDRLVLPRAVAVTVGLIAFQVAMAITILTRGDVTNPALIIGGIFAIAVSLVSSPGGTVGNLALAAIQFGLAIAS